jgi:hypothetical protein
MRREGNLHSGRNIGHNARDVRSKTGAKNDAKLMKVKEV